MNGNELGFIRTSKEVSEMIFWLERGLKRMSEDKVRNNGEITKYRCFITALHWVNGEYENLI